MDHQLNENGFEKAPGDGEGQGNLEFMGCKQLDMTE